MISISRDPVLKEKTNQPTKTKQKQKQNKKPKKQNKQICRNEKTLTQLLKLFVGHKLNFYLKKKIAFSFCFCFVLFETEFLLALDVVERAGLKFREI